MHRIKHLPFESAVRVLQYMVTGIIEEHADETQRHTEGTELLDVLRNWRKCQVTLIKLLVISHRLL